MAFDKMFKRKPKNADESEAGVAPITSDWPETEAEPADEATELFIDEIESLDEEPELFAEESLAAHWAGFSTEPDDDDDDDNFFDGEDEDLSDSDIKIDMDKQISEMLAMDEQAEQDFFDPEPHKYLVSQSVYEDGSVQTSNWTTYSQNTDRIDRLRARLAQEEQAAAQAVAGRFVLPRIVTHALIFALVILGLGATIIFVAQQAAAKQARLDAISHFSAIKQPVNAPNNANFIYLNKKTSVNRQDFTLAKMSVGGTDTLFFFEEAFDPKNYIITLTDQKNTLYHRYQNDTQYNPESGTVLKFDKLYYDSFFLTLFIQDIETSEHASFYFRFEAPLVFTAPLYLNRPVTVFDESGFTIRLEQAEADNAGVDFLYTLQWEKDDSQIRFGEGGVPSVELRDGSRYLPAFADKPVEYRYDDLNLSMGRVSFAPARQRNYPLEFVFKDLHYYYTLPTAKADLRKLFAYRENGPQELRAGQNTLVLEAMATQNEVAVLTLHSVDENGNRLLTRMDADLVIETARGDITVPGVCHYTAEGSDMVFDLSSVRAQIDQVPLSRYSLDIKGVLYSVPRLSVKIPPDAYSEYADERLYGISQSVHAAFLSRLAYKSFEIPFEEITGFSEELLADRALTRLYAPVAAGEGARYSAKVINGLIYKGQYLAVVEEEWVVGEGEDIVFLSATHQIAAVKAQAEWTINKDGLLKPNADIDTALPEQWVIVRDQVIK